MTSRSTPPTGEPMQAEAGEDGSAVHTPAHLPGVAQMPATTDLASGSTANVPASSEQNKKSIRARRRREARFGWTFLAPFTIFFTISFVIPILVSIRSSFFKLVPKGGGLYGGGESVEQFVGLQNYEEVVMNARFWRGIGRVLLFGAFQIPVMILGALALALLLDSLLIRRISAYRLGFFLPYAIPGIIAAMVWLYLYNPQMSPIVYGLQQLGFDVNFFDRNIILASMANMTTWTFTGYNMLIFLAALHSVPSELYEAARIDGATGWQVITKIKIPLLRPAALLAVLLSIIGTIQLFNEPQVMYTQNTWMGADYTPMMMAYNTMMGQLSPSGAGPASAVSIVMALIAAVLAAIYAFAQRKVD
ncbi:MAG: sugar ABC transporter permease [Bowdeniella nasicola]|nr:sugar ABC transporter permease [Bowdeniella nasicola]